MRWISHEPAIVSQVRLITAADLLSDDLRQALDAINHAS
jgi:hypothetical protein